MDAPGLKPAVFVLPSFDPKHPRFLERTRYLELHGGLGDTFNWCYLRPHYSELDSLPAKERIFIVVATHNPFTWELFGWHRNAHQLTIAKWGYTRRMPHPEYRREHGFPEHRKEWPWDAYPRSGPVNFYAPPDEYPIIREEKTKGRYVLFSLTASDNGRSIPASIANAAARVCLGKGYRVLLTGRTYAFALADPQESRHGRRPEIRVELQDGVVDLVDRLTVPGVSSLVAGASAVLTCHSALNILAWRLRRRTYLLYDNSVERHYFKPLKERCIFTFGARWRGNHSGHRDFYSDDHFRAYLDALPT